MDNQTPGTINKLCFIEFDNVLCLHYGDLSFDESIYFKSLKDASKQLYANSYVNMPVYRYLIALQEIGYQMVLISHANSKFLSLKKEWIKEHCRQVKFKDYLGVLTDFEKMDIINYYKSYLNLDNKSIVFIDSNLELNIEAKRNGIELLSPQLVSNEMYAQLVEDNKEKKSRPKTESKIQQNPTNNPPVDMHEENSHLQNQEVS